MTPLANSYPTREQAQRPEVFYPLHARVCSNCFLVQIGEFAAPEAIFRDYAYFSSYADTWLAHARRFAQNTSERLGLGPRSFVVELASNDGYLLRNFVDRQIPCLGIEPARNIAKRAREAGVPTISEFFGTKLARRLLAKGKQADLIVANNVLAHVPDLNDFIAGMKTLLAPRGTISIEFPHLQRLIEGNQFDTIYHEHFSYFSFISAERCLRAAGLTVFDVEELPTHGGSLRLHVRHAQDDRRAISAAARDLAARERRLGYEDVKTYEAFAERVRQTKRALLALLVKIKNERRHIAAYGAAAKGNTLLNYCGIGTDFIDYVVDRSPHKQGLLLPGTHIPIRAPEALKESRPDYLLILPWNLKEEIMKQTAFIKDWGGRHAVPIPEPVVL